jgi:hypothetical protein
VLWQPTEPEHRRRLAWSELAAANTPACRATLRRLFNECWNPDKWKALVSTSAPDAPLPRGEFQRLAVIARATALLPDAVQPADFGTLYPLAHSAQTPWDDWQGHEMLGAVLYRAGQPEDAIRELNEAVHQHGSGGSTWAKLFLALAHRRLGRAEQAQLYRQQAQAGPTWEDAVIHRQLLSELDAAR